jgi:hypothetical protein
MRYFWLLISLLFAGTLLAEPPTKPWYKDWKVWRMIGFTVGSDIARTYEGHKCRERKNAGIAFCDGGYGPYAAREAVVDGGGLLLDGIGIWGRHMGIKEYSLFADGFSGYNTYVAYHEASLGCKAGTWPVWGTKYNCVAWTWPTQNKEDMSHVIIVHH